MFYRLPRFTLQRNIGYYSHPKASKLCHFTVIDCQSFAYCVGEASKSQKSTLSVLSPSNSNGDRYMPQQCAKLCIIKGNESNKKRALDHILFTANPQYAMRATPSDSASAFRSRSHLNCWHNLFFA
jgi:hypothetical protein